MRSDASTHADALDGVGALIAALSYSPRLNKLERMERERQRRDMAKYRAEIQAKWDARQLHSRRIGRNEKCPCGSGKKFKQCCKDDYVNIELPKPQEESET